MRMSLQLRLTLNFLIIVLIMLGILALAANQIITSRFNNLVFNAGRQYAERITPLFAAYYASNQSWEGVEDIFPVLPIARSGLSPYNENRPNAFPRWTNPVRQPTDERIILVNPDGIIIFDSNADNPLTIPVAENLDKGIKIMANNELVGTLLIASSLGMLSQAQQGFLREVNILLVSVAGVTAIIAVLIGWMQARQIVSPVKAISSAAARVAAGDYSQRIPIKSRDELGEMANAFNTMAADLATQQDLRKRAMADIAHELRTPLSVLQIDLESIEDGISQPDAENIESLLDQVGYLNKLVEDLRILSLAEAGELQFEMQPMDVNTLVKMITNRVRKSVQEKGKELAMDLSSDAVVANIDEQRMAQVILNILANATQHTADGDVITVKTARQGQEAVISIEDTGEGIPEKDLEHIFERLYRASSSRSHQNGGSGLGLSIARSLIQAHGGKIWAESVQGEGTKITFTLPLIGS